MRFCIHLLLLTTDRTQTTERATDGSTSSKGVDQAIDRLRVVEVNVWIVRNVDGFLERFGRTFNGPTSCGAPTHTAKQALPGRTRQETRAEEQLANQFRRGIGQSRKRCSSAARVATFQLLTVDVADTHAVAGGKAGCRGTADLV